MIVNLKFLSSLFIAEIAATHGVYRSAKTMNAIALQIGNTSFSMPLSSAKFSAP